MADDNKKARFEFTNDEKVERFDKLYDLFERVKRESWSKEDLDYYEEYDNLLKDFGTIIQGDIPLKEFLLNKTERMYTGETILEHFFDRIKVTTAKEMKRGVPDLGPFIVESTDNKKGELSPKEAIAQLCVDKIIDNETGKRKPGINAKEVCRKVYNQFCAERENPIYPNSKMLYEVVKKRLQR
ncbi:hypothetical protein KJ966_10165 [bacterium]|nr:hypothetical protein [bacterium]